MQEGMIRRIVEESSCVCGCSKYTCVVHILFLMLLDLML